jgi:hypothetical protein
LGAGDLEKNTDGHRGSFGLRRKEPRKLTGGLEEPQIWAETEKSRAAKTTQGRRHRTETRNRFPGIAHYGAEPPSESITEEEKKKQETEVWTRTPSRNKDLEAMSTSHLEVAHHKSKVKWITHTRSKNVFLLKLNMTTIDLRWLPSSLPHLTIGIKI